MISPRGVIIAGASSHSGKTIVALGLIAALRARGLGVGAAKCGPDYIDPRFLEAASGAPAVNLDPWAMTRERLQTLLARQAAGNDIVVVEGVMGLFDGGPGGAGSTADLARRIGLPVIVVVSGQGVAQTAAAIAGGLARLADFPVAGAIVNHVASDRHAALIREGFDKSSVPLLGLVRRDAGVVLPSRHLGLVQAEEHEDLARKIFWAGDLVAAGCNLQAIVGAPFSQREKGPAKRADEGLPTPIGAGTNPSPVAVGDTLSLWEREDRALPPSPLSYPPPQGGRGLAPLGQRIAVARDVAFAFSYPHLLTDWRDQGAEISFFSPLNDEGPREDADAVFLPGGYPELHAGRIATAEKFRVGMLAAANRGALIYGECGGYMVLGESLTDAEGKAHRMFGLLPVSTSFAEPKLHLGYRRLKPLKDVPWRGELMAHEFHFARIVKESQAERLFEASAADGTPIGEIGLRRGSVMGSFAHVIDAAACI